MRRLAETVLIALILGHSTAASAKADNPPISAVAEASLTTAAEQIRQFAFDGDTDTFFASEKNPGEHDHFTLRFDQPVALKSIAAITGRPAGVDKLADGTLEGSADGKQFDELAKFAAGEGTAKPSGRKLQAIRIKPAADAKNPLVIREIIIDSDPVVAVFKYPVEFVVDVSDAPEMQDWADKAAQICTRAYPMINEELKTDGYKPPHVIHLRLKKDYRGVAAAGGGRITGSVKFFKDHPDDFGAMVHETVHIVQKYGRRRGNPSWLVEGVADYIRFFKYEPGKIGRLNIERARYDRSYRVSAAFLAFVTDKYDKQLVRKLNQAMRAGEYKEEMFKDATGKTVQELDEEWRAALRAKS
jgi:hypothetical protein